MPPTHANAIVDLVLSLDLFKQLSGHLAGYHFVKVVVERGEGRVHFINNRDYQFHSDYIAEHILHLPQDAVSQEIDRYNRTFYYDEDRDYLLGTLAFHQRADESFFTLETVEVDTMGVEMAQEFFEAVCDKLDQGYKLFFKPGNHAQEAMIEDVEASALPRMYSHEIFSSAPYVALNEGRTRGRIRIFESEEEFMRERDSLRWYDIIVMNRIPDEVPRVAGFINAQATTPLSHTNVLAHGWRIPNAIQKGIIEKLQSEKLNKVWVLFSVSLQKTEVGLERIEKPKNLAKRPQWHVTQVKIDVPETENVAIESLKNLRISHRFRYGTKAANIGELLHLLEHASERLLGFYRVKRPPRDNLLPYLAKHLGSTHTAPSLLAQDAWDYLRENINVPHGIAVPFSVQQQFLTTSPAIQQQIGKLKMALELNAKEIDAVCIKLQRIIVGTRMPTAMRDLIDNAIVEHLGGVSSFVVRSSSNAEDLEDFSAAGIYESINHVATAEGIFDGIKEVWASLVSPRSVRLRHEVGISLDDSYMGVIIQEEVRNDFGGVMVTMNPNNLNDFRNVFLNVSPDVTQVVEGKSLPLQYLFNTVEGGGQTLSLGSADHDLSADRQSMLQRLAVMGKLLQSHFSPDYTFNSPQDIEWAVQGDDIHILQLRPYVMR